MSAISQPLEDRVARLERQNRWLRLAVLVVVLVVGAILARELRSGAGGSVVAAEQFIVRDAQGRTRALLGLDHPSAPQHSPVRLGLYNDEYQASAVLYLSDAFGGLTIQTGAGEKERSTSLAVNPKDGAAMTLGTGLRRTPVRMTADSTAAVRMVMEDATGNVVFRAP